MNFSNKHHEIVDQNDTNVKKSHKHDANVQKNSTLYFQIGLIITLLFTYGLLEMQFLTKTIDIPGNIPIDEDEFIVSVTPFVEPKKDVKKEVKRQEPKRRIMKPIFTNVGKESSLKEPVITSPDKPNINLTKPKIVEPAKPRTIRNIEQVPIYPGCENFLKRHEQIKCMSDKINKLIGRKFDTEVAVNLGLKGITRVYVQFTIDEFGKVTNIKAKGPHRRLEQEAKKAVSKIPEMQPGKQQNKNVSVVYSLPIVVQVQN